MLPCSYLACFLTCGNPDYDVAMQVLKQHNALPEGINSEAAA